MKTIVFSVNLPFLNILISNGKIMFSTKRNDPLSKWALLLFQFQRVNTMNCISIWKTKKKRKDSELIFPFDRSRKICLENWIYFLSSLFWFKKRSRFCLTLTTSKIDKFLTFLSIRQIIKSKILNFSFHSWNWHSP